MINQDLTSTPMKKDKINLLKEESKYRVARINGFAYNKCRLQYIGTIVLGPSDGSAAKEGLQGMKEVSYLPTPLRPNATESRIQVSPGIGYLNSESPVSPNSGFRVSRYRYLEI